MIGMLKNSKPPSPQQIISSLKIHKFYIAKETDSKVDEFQHSNLSYKTELQEIIKLYHDPDLSKDLDLVCKYVLETQQQISIHYGIMKSMQLDKNQRVTECRILGVKSRELNLNQFIKAYQNSHLPQLTQKISPIFKNRTLQYRKKWAQNRFGLAKTRKSSSQSFQEEIVVKPKTKNKQKSGTQPTKTEKRKLKLISGSQISNEDVVEKNQPKQKSSRQKPTQSKKEKIIEKKQQLKIKNFKSKAKKENSTDSIQNNRSLGQIIEADKHEQISNKKVVPKRQSTSKERSIEKDTEKFKPNERLNQGLLKKIIKIPVKQEFQSYVPSEKEQEEQSKLLAELSITQSNVSLAKPSNSLDSKRNVESSQTAKITQFANTAKQKKSKKKKGPPPNNTTLDQFFKHK